MKKGFTLNELLIAMTIIGIVAALYTPRLIANIDKKTKVTALQRIYSVANEAIGALMVDERAKDLNSTILYDEEGSYSSEPYTCTFINKYFKVKKLCDSDVYECFAVDYKNVNGDDVSTPDQVSCCAVVNNGVAVCMRNARTDSSEFYPLAMWIDTNGKKGPNMSGRDYFRFFVYEDGEIRDGLSEYGTESDSDPYFGDVTIEPADCLSNTYGGGCLTRIKQADWVMDY